MTAAELEVPTPRPIDYPDEWPPGSGRYGPQPRQLLAHELAPVCDEVLYGGARGGGKTDWLLAEGLRRCEAVPGLSAVFFRRTYKELEGQGGAIIRLLSRIPRTYGRWNANNRRWTFHNGSTLTLSYLESPADVQAWLGLELQLMLFDQVEQIDEETYVMVRTSLRAAGPVARLMQAAGLHPAAAASANPGGRGHAWVKRRFVDPFPLGAQMFRAAPTEDEPAPMVRLFVPARLQDNPALDLGDPTYRARLQALPAEDRKAQLEGDWNVFKGARFAEFRTDIHVRTPEDLPLPAVGLAPRAVGVDYGSENPFVALWGARIGDDLIVVYREVWGRGLSPAEQAERLLAAETPEERAPGAQTMTVALDPASWTAPADQPLARVQGKAIRPTGPPVRSVAWYYARAGVPVERADNRRIVGAADIAARLTVRKDGLPRLLISSACPKLIETLPLQQRDPKSPEDVLKNATDHWYDALRYLVAKLGFLQLQGSSAAPPDRRLDGRRRGEIVVEPARRTRLGTIVPEGISPRGARHREF